MKKILLLTTIILCFSLQLSARRAPERPFPYRQPDGTSLLLKVHGDAFLHYTTTLDGSLVQADENGWMCYAWFGKDSAIINSGIRVGARNSAAEAARSKIIPSETLRQLRAKQKKVVQEHISTLHLMGKEEQHDIEGERYALVILAQYKDISFQYKKEDFVNMLTQKGYSRFGAQGCAAEYFNEQFGEKVNFHFDVSSIITLPENREYYGKNVGTPPNDQDARPEEMIAKACELADAEIDFTKYDADKDGTVDNVFVFFAGNDEAETQDKDCIWSHAYYIYGGSSHIDLVLDGVRIDRYACTSEMTFRKKTGGYMPELAGIGTFCHEFSHTFGLPDFYDTDYEGSDGTAKALWRTTSLMDGGNHNNEGNTPPYYNAIEREMLGLSTPVELSKSGTYTLEPINVKGQCYRISTLEPEEYFLLECRYPEGWDKHCGGKGLLVYHIDRSDRPAGFSDSYNQILTARQRWGGFNEVNCRPDRQCAALIAADPDSENASGVFYPQENKAAIFGSDLKFWEGGESGVTLKNIRWEGRKIVFDAIVEESKIFPINVKSRPFHDEIIIDFETQTDISKASVSYALAGIGNIGSFDVEAYAPKKFSARLSGLSPDTKYIVKILLDTENASPLSLTIRTMEDAVLSYIHLLDIEGRYPTGAFRQGTEIPLQVICKEQPCKVQWFFNNTEITAGKNNRYQLQRSGELKAEIYYESGKNETLTKAIRIK